MNERTNDRASTVTLRPRVNYNPREIVANIRRLMNGLEPTPMVSCSRLWLDPLVTSKTVLH